MTDHASTPQAATNPGESPIEIPAEMPGSVPQPEPAQPVEPEHPTIPPEARNLSQDDEGEQAQSLADEALGRSAAIEAGDSERVPLRGYDIDHDGGSRPDLVDTMSQTISSGRIDMSAYRGERMDDDVERGLGPQGTEDDFPPHDE